MKSLLLFIVTFFSISSLAENVCLEKSEIYTFGIYHELIGENKQAILFNIELLEMTLRVIDKISEDHQVGTVELLDNMQELYLERIVTAIETQKKFNLDVALYESRLSSVLRDVANKEKYFPVTLNSSAYKIVSEEVNKKL